MAKIQDKTPVKTPDPIELDVPVDIAVDARVVDGAIEARDLHSGGRLETRDGDLHVEDSGGPLELRTRDGQVYVSYRGGKRVQVFGLDGTYQTQVFVDPSGDHVRTR